MVGAAQNAAHISALKVGLVSVFVTLPPSIGCVLEWTR